MSEHQKIFQEVGLALDVGQWLVDLAKMRIYWPRGLGIAEMPTRYVWTSLDVVTQHYDEGERRRFLAYIEDLVRNPGVDRILTIAAKGLGETRLPLRMSGRYVHMEAGSYIFGMIEAIGANVEMEERARSMALIVDSIFHSVSAGMIVLDEALHVRRANREAMELFGITSVDAPQAQIFAEMDRKIPSDMRMSLASCIRQRSAMSGQYASAMGDRFQWRANPWGQSEAGGRGIVVVFNRGKSAETEPAPVMDGALRVLEHVHLPVLVVKSTTGEIRFANHMARESFHMKSGERHFAKNLGELCGRPVPPESFEAVRKGAAFINLKTGARISRVENGSDELLLEYGL